MFTTKKGKFTRLLCQLTAMILIMLMLVSCGKKTPAGGAKTDGKGKAEVTTKSDEQIVTKTEQQKDEQKDTNSQQQGGATVASDQPSNAAESLDAYLIAKNELLSTLTSALSNNPDTALESMFFLDILAVDLALMPASFFGLGQEVANASLDQLASLGFIDAEYNENGNKYSIKYKNAEGRQYELQGEYDKAADALKCISIVDGKEALISEHCRTSFGYAGQIHTIGDDGSSTVYQLAISGENGAVGISKASKAPPALTGSEKIDFPKQCEQWYAIDGEQVTGKTSGGREISFKYTPSKD